MVGIKNTNRYNTKEIVGVKERSFQAISPLHYVSFSFAFFSFLLPPLLCYSPPTITSLSIVLSDLDWLTLASILLPTYIRHFFWREGFSFLEAFTVRPYLVINSA